VQEWSDLGRVSFMHTANARVRATICRLASAGAEAARFGIEWMNLGDGSGQVPEDVEAPLDGKYGSRS
jgi:hypothetical protein